MGDRTRSLTVILNQQYKDEDLELIESSIKMTKGVQEVLRGKEYSDLNSLTIKLDLFEKLTAWLRKELLGWKE